MPHTCPHDRCTFFIRESVAQCLGCGRSARSPRTGLIRGDGQGVVLTTAALLGLLLGVLPMLWLAQSSWLVGLVVAAIAGVVGWVVLRNQRATSTFTSVDSGYRRAVDECTLWLGTWSELFTLAADANHMPEDERLLLVEAQAAAAAPTHMHSRSVSAGQGRVTQGATPSSVWRRAAAGARCNARMCTVRRAQQPHQLAPTDM